MQRHSSSWGLSQSLGLPMGSPNGYESISQDDRSGFVHSVVYNFVDSDEYIYDGNEWDDDLEGRSDGGSKKSPQTTNLESDIPNRLDRWGDYAGSWEDSSGDESTTNPTTTTATRQARDQQQRRSTGSPGSGAKPGDSPKSVTSSTGGNGRGGFWGLFSKQRQQQPQVEPYRRCSS